MSSKKNLFKAINSFYLLKNILSLLEKRRSLDILSRNKSLQKKLEITLQDYKNISGKYLKHEREEFGFDYNDCVYIKDTNYLIFKGKYSHGKKNGHGTEFYTNKRKKFKGEYLNGVKISGIGYDKLGNIIFEMSNKVQTEKYINGNRVFKGKYLNTKKWKGIGYDINGNKAYEIKYGRGFVKEYFDDGKLKFEGEYFNGERNGKGKRYDYEQEIKFEGEYKNGERWTGKGKEYYTDQDKKNDIDPFVPKIDLFTTKKKEIGIFKPRPSRFKRAFDFFLGEKEPDPLITDSFKNIFKNHNLERITTERLGMKFEKKIAKYEGEYLNGERHGKGKEFNEEGILIYEGEYANGKRHGIGKQYDGDLFALGKEPKLIYEGEFKNGRWNGKGKEYEKSLIGIYDGKLKHEGNFVDGKYVGK